MMQMVKIEFEKLFGNVRFYASMSGIALGMLLDALETLRHSEHAELDNLFSHAARGPFFLLSFMLCIVGGGFSFCIEQKNQCVRYEVLRCSIRAYSAAKVFVSFAGGYLVFFLGMLLGECSMGVALLCRFRSMSNIIANVPGLQDNLAYIVTYALLSGVFSVTALLVTVAIPDFFVAMSMPVLIYYMWLNISGWLRLPEFLDIRLIYNSYSSDFDFGRSCRHFSYAALFTMCLLYGMWLLIHRGMKRRAENG